MNTFALTILTPEGRRFSAEAAFLQVDTGAGRIGILSRHMSLLTALVPGELTIRDANGAEHTAQCGSGVLLVGKEGVTITTRRFAMQNGALEKMKKDQT